MFLTKTNKTKTSTTTKNLKASIKWYLKKEKGKSGSLIY